MNKHTKIIALLTLCFWTGHAFAQKQTEVHIPIGQSPGVSGIHTVTGVIDSVSIGDSDSPALIVLGDGSTEIETAASTNIYLDNSTNRTRNERGQLSDLKIGLFIEVKYKNNDPEDIAEWVKIRME